MVTECHQWLWIVNYWVYDLRMRGALNMNFLVYVILIAERELYIARSDRLNGLMLFSLASQTLTLRSV